METRVSTCTFCDGGCTLRAEVEDGRIVKVQPANPQMPAMCDKAMMIDAYRTHPQRLTRPLKRTGQRGGGLWEEISWEQALDEIAEKLSAIVNEHGPEAVAFAEMPLNHGFGGITRRFMNHLGAVNYTAPTQLCMGNTAQVHRAVYGWFASADWAAADCVVYFGQDRDSKRWPAEYLALKVALARGATLIEVDPRETETAKLATHHLRIRYGTDAALVLGWLNVIIEEGLYDHEFVEAQCLGFEELKARVAEYPAARVAEICGISEDEIRETARAYANAKAAIIPWGVVGDMQVNSTGLLLGQCALRAICGYLNVSERVMGPAVGGVTNSQLADYDALPEKQRVKQLGRDTHPLLTMRASEQYRGVRERFQLPYEPDLLAETCSCSPADLFAAMRGEGPYPVKAFFAVANNTVMSYANQQGIVEALLNQDLVVAYENWMTPTAQLADYVLPGDMWFERDTLGPAFDVAPALITDQTFCVPPEGCRDWYFVMKELACRLGMREAFPWKDARELFDWRLAPLGTTYAETSAQHIAPMKPIAFGQFATPSGKVELKSSVLQNLGFDPLPSYVEPHDPEAEKNPDAYPYIAFAGYRERESYNTNFHQVEKLRAREPEPEAFINPADAQVEGIVDGQWCTVSSAYGSVELKAKVDAAQPTGSIRIPHGWWKPETAQGMQGGLSGAMLHNDGMLMPDAEWNLDPAQGVPGLRGSIRVNIKAK